MLTRESLRACRSAESVIGLFETLGYPVAPVEIDRCAWKQEGLDVPGGVGVRFLHLCRVGDTDLYLLIGEVEPADVSVFAKRLNQRNKISKIVLIYLDHKFKCISLYTPTTKRRLEISLEAPRSDSIDRLNQLLLVGNEATSLFVGKLFERAVDRETLTRRFFQRFKQSIDAVTAALNVLCPTETHQARREESLLLLSRILFLYFIQGKGWLAGSRRFLIDQFDLAQQRGKGFHETVLEPLFFECLNTPLRSRSSRARRLGRIPYLNGGLFDPSAFEGRNRGVVLGNDLLRNIFDDVFERFAFTVDEGDEEGVHIDPEMLGKVFESLMAADERAASGSFYTPKVIVDVLTDAAIVEWVTEGRCSLNDALRALLSNESASLDPSEAARLLIRLQSLTVLDPACGSGAFLLSSLHVIERLTRGLAALTGSAVGTDLRHDIVARCLYGVDLKAEAVRLCELRLWLAIVAGSEHSVETVPPLPNLDRNILQGNSLLTPLDFLGAGRREAYREWSEALRSGEELTRRYQRALPPQKPALARALRARDLGTAASLLKLAIANDQEEIRVIEDAPALFELGRRVERPSTTYLKRRIAENQSHLQRARRGELDFFSFDIQFADVMSAGGFAVVAGNPPWVRIHRIDPTLRKMCSERYRFFRRPGSGRRGFDQPDLSLAFFERALSLVQSSGVVSFLMPAKAATADYGRSFRLSLSTEHTLVAFHDWTDEARRLFDADTFPLGITVRRGGSGQRAIEVASNGMRFHLPLAAIGAGNSCGRWSLLRPEIAAILTRLRQEHPALAEQLHRRPIMGVKTGANGRFFLRDLELRKGRTFLADSGIEIPADALSRCIRGRNIRRWKSTGSIWMLWPPIGGWSSPPRWARKLAESWHVEIDELALAYARPEHLGLKVVWKDVSKGLQAVVVPATVRIGAIDYPLVPNQTTYALDAVSLDEAYAICALLNSTIVNALALAIADRAKDSHYRYFGSTIAQLPWPQVPDPSTQRGLVRLARLAHQGHEVQDDVDRIVCRLYGVSADECSLLKSWLSERFSSRSSAVIEP